MEKLTYLDVIDIALNLSIEAKNFYENLLKEIEEEVIEKERESLIELYRKLNGFPGKYCSFKNTSVKGTG